MGEYIFVFVHFAVKQIDCKITNSNRHALKTTRKRLYCSDFKDRLVHFNGAAVKNAVKDHDSVFFHNHNFKKGKQWAYRVFSQVYDIRHKQHWYEPGLPHAVFLNGYFVGMLKDDQLRGGCRRETMY